MSYTAVTCIEISFLLHRQNFFIVMNWIEEIISIEKDEKVESNTEQSYSFVISNTQRLVDEERREYIDVRILAVVTAVV